MSEKRLKKNISLGYWLIALHHSFFWYAPWLLFLLKHIDLTQAAILTSVGLVTSILVDVPSGAISDLIGKKKMLQAAFFVAGIGELITAFSSTFPMFILAFVVKSVGYSFYSGMMEAFMFDTLVGDEKEEDYPKIISRSEAVTTPVLITIATP